MGVDGILDELVRLYANAGAPLLQVVLPIALGLAGALFSIQIAWDASMWVLLDTDQAFGKAVRKGMIFLFIYGFISLSPLWLPQILEGFEVLGQQVTGLEGLAPSALVDQGFELGADMFKLAEELVGISLPFLLVFQFLAMLLIVVAFSLVALQVTKVLVEATLALGGLAVFLGFATHRLTFPLAEGYLRYLVELGTRIYVLFLIVGVGSNLGNEWRELLGRIDALSLHGHFLILVAVSFFAYLSWVLPKEISRRIAGSFHLTGQGLLQADA